MLSYLSCACGAVYPELASPVRPASGRRLEPPPPADLVFIRFASAEIPSRTRDGRQWDSVGGSKPDPFAKLFVDGKERILTPVQSNTLTPTWPDQHVGNYSIRPGAPVRVELWDSNPINNHPICVSAIDHFLEEANTEHNVEIECESGARIELAVQPAHAKFGIGFYYELRTEDIYVTRVLRESPAARAGLRAGVQILKIQGLDVKSIDGEHARSLINANAGTGLNLVVKRPDGSMADVALRDGPIYPGIDEDVAVE